MTQQTVKFEVIECNVTGDIGLAPAGMEIHEDYIASTVGFTIAHDLIEHPNGMDKIGGVGDELEATGCIWYTRGQHCDMQRPDRSIYTPEQSVAHEIETNYRYWIDRGCEFDMPVPRSKPSIHDASLICILRYGVEFIRAENDCDPDEKLDITLLAEFIRAAKHFMRSGIEKQEARFPLHQYQANNEFWNVQEAVEPFAASLDHEGQTFDLRWGDGEAIMVETFPDDDWDDMDNLDDDGEKYDGLDEIDEDCEED